MYGALIPVHLSKPDPYLEREQEQISHLVGLLQQGGQTVALYPSGRKEPFAISTLLEASQERLVFDAPKADWIQQQLLAQGICCVAQVRGVLIQFDVHALGIIAYDRAPALEATWPTAVLRLQRRQAYRAAIPMQLHATCTLPEGDVLEVADLSAGGVGLIAHSALAALRAGAQLSPCTLQLNEFGSFEVTLLIRTLQAQMLKSGAQVQRVGCGFVSNDPQDSQRLARLAVQLERLYLERR
ncbi:flagellar brake protein [Chitinibacteraceae bacterium HSL-7]